MAGEPPLEALTCSHCCAPLPPPTANTSVCRFCGMAHFLAPPPREEPEDVDEDEDEDEDEEDEDEEVIPMNDPAVLALLRERCSGESTFYVAPGIPARKERNVRELHAAHLPPHEPILGLYDGTVFGAADDGFVLNAWRLCWRNFTEEPHTLLWHEIDPETIRVVGNKIHLRHVIVETYLASDSDFMDVLGEVFPILARSARKAAATPRPAPVAPPPAVQGHGPVSGYGAPPSLPVGPPAHGGYAAAPAPPVFGCWHCRTPLHWQQPRCGRCGALPGPQGWPRLA
jgi:hypothetical protein